MLMNEGEFKRIAAVWKDLRGTDPAEPVDALAQWVGMAVLDSESHRNSKKRITTKPTSNKYQLA